MKEMRAGGGGRCLLCWRRGARPARWAGQADMRQGAGGRSGWRAAAALTSEKRKWGSHRGQVRKSKTNRAIEGTPGPQKTTLFRPPVRTPLRVFSPPASQSLALRHFRQAIEPIAVERKASRRPIGAQWFHGSQ